MVSAGSLEEDPALFKAQSIRELHRILFERPCGEFSFLYNQNDLTNTQIATNNIKANTQNK